MGASASPSTSPTLLEALGLPGSDAAWEVFVRLYGPLIDDRCRRAGLQDADAEDVRSHVLTSLIMAMREFKYDPARRFRGYLQTVVANAIRKLWRERHRRPGDQAVGEADLDEIPQPVAELAIELDDDLYRRLRTANRVMNLVRNCVEPNTWQAYWRTSIEGRGAKDVAQELGKSVRSVYMAKYRVGQMLRDQGSILDGQVDDDRPSDD